MVCCGCSPVAVSTIYEKIDLLAAKGVVCPYACACAQGRLLRCAGRFARPAADRTRPAAALAHRNPGRGGCGAGPGNRLTQLLW